METVVHYFFYGTLIDADIRRCILGCQPAVQVETAWLSGFRRVRVPGKAYPALIAGTDAVEGILVAGVMPRQRARLAAFEGPEYREALLPVRGTLSGAVQARVFVLRRSPRLTMPWAYERWRQIDKARLLHKLTVGIRL